MKHTYDDTLFCARVQSGIAQTEYQYKDRLPMKSWETKERGNADGNSESGATEAGGRLAVVPKSPPRYVGHRRAGTVTNRATLCTTGAVDSRDVGRKIKVSGPITVLPQTVHGIARYNVPIVSADGETVRWTTPIVVTSQKGKEIAQSQEKLQRIANKHKSERNAYREDSKRQEQWQRRQSNKKAFPWSAIVQGEDKYGTKKESE